MKRKLLSILTLTVICCFLSASVSFARVHTSDFHESYADYQSDAYKYTIIPYLDDLKHVFRDSNDIEIEISINEKFHQPRPWNSTNDTHEGVDFSASFGTEVYAPFKSKVVYKHFVSSSNPSQNYVILQLDLNQDDIFTEDLYAVYMHMSEVFVNIGDELDSVDEVGKTGWYQNPTTGTHLHFGLTNNIPVNGYTDLIWVPNYYYFNRGGNGIYNSGKDYDMLYSYVPPETSEIFPFSDIGDVQIKGYYKGTASDTGQVLSWIKFYHRFEGATTWNVTQLSNSTGTKDGFYNVSLVDLGYTPKQTVQYFFVGKAPNSNSWYAKVAYYPGKYYIPPEDPLSQNLQYNYLSYTIPGDSFEPNDTIQDAKYFQIGQTISGTISTYSDKDHFYFNHPGGNINITLNAPYASYTLTLMYPGGGMIAHDQYNGSGNLKIRNISTFLPAGTYIVKVGNNSTFTYSRTEYYGLIAVQ